MKCEVNLIRKTLCLNTGYSHKKRYKYNVHDTILIYANYNNHVKCEVNWITHYHCINKTQLHHVHDLPFPQTLVITTT